MDNSILKEKMLSRSEALWGEDRILALAYRLYAHELIFEDTGSGADLEEIKAMVMKTGPVLEELARLQEEDGSIGASDKEVTCGSRIYLSSVFAGVMCIASRVYANLDPVFSRDIVHAALDAGHYLLVGQYKKEGSDSSDENDSRRVSIMDLGSRDEEITLDEKAAQMWAYAELIRTDIEIRNAYDHSMMAGMPQKMSRQKRYEIRLDELINKCIKDYTDAETGPEKNAVKSEGADGADKNTVTDLFLLTDIAVLLDEDENASDKARDMLYEYLSNLAEGITSASEGEPKTVSDVADIALTVAVLSMQMKLTKDSSSTNNGSDLIKVIEYNVIGDTKKSLTEEEKTQLRARIEKCFSVILG